MMLTVILLETMGIYIKIHCYYSRFERSCLQWILF